MLDRSDFPAIFSRYSGFKRTGGWEQLPAVQQWKRVLAISLAASIVAAVPVIALYRIHQPRQVLLVFFYTVVCSSIIGALNGVVLIRFGRWMYLHPYPINWALLSGGILASTAAGSLISNLIFLGIQLLPSRDFLSSFWLVNQFAAVISLIFGLSGFAHEVMRTTLEAAMLELRNRQLEAQLAALESHIRPHFLFNALNTISAMIHDDPVLAESLIGKLAALLRSSLDANHHRTAPLSSELKLVRDYLEIETARFGDRLRFRIDAPQELESTGVPTFCLQTLVENSVKHAIAPRPDGGTIEIRARAENGCVCLEVSDRGPGFTLAAIQPGHGLENLQGRLAALYGTSAKLEIDNLDGHTTVRLRIP
jgi:signal transduction histidine kinase